MIHWRCLFLGERLFLCFFFPVGRLTLGLIVPFKDFIALLVGFLIIMFRLRWWTSLSTRSPPRGSYPGTVISCWGGVLGWYVGVTVRDLFRGDRPPHPVYLKVKKYLTLNFTSGKSFFFLVISPPEVPPGCFLFLVGTLLFWLAVSTRVDPTNPENTKTSPSGQGVFKLTYLPPSVKRVTLGDRLGGNLLDKSSPTGEVPQISIPERWERLRWFLFGLVLLGLFVPGGLASIWMVTVGVLVVYGAELFILPGVQILPPRGICHAGFPPGLGSLDRPGPWISLGVTLVWFGLTLEGMTWGLLGEGLVFGVGLAYLVDRILGVLKFLLTRVKRWATSLWGGKIFKRSLV